MTTRWGALPDVELSGDLIVSGHHRAVAAAEQGRPVVCRDVVTGEKSLRMAVLKEEPSPSKARLLAQALYGMEHAPSAWRRLPQAERDRLVARAAEAMRRAGVA